MDALPPGGSGSAGGSGGAPPGKGEQQQQQQQQQVIDLFGSYLYTAGITLLLLLLCLIHASMTRCTC